MKLIQRSYQFELLPTKKQKILLDKHFGCIRFVYNYFLNQRKELYQTSKTSTNYYTQSSILTSLKKENETQWLNEVNSQSLQSSLRNLETAYVNFFRGTAKFPRFKSKRRKNSFTIPQHTSLENNRIYIPKFKEGIKVIKHREIKGTIGKFTISKHPSGKYFVSILSEENYQPIPKTGAVCGIDLGLKESIVTSDNERFKNNKYTKQYEIKLAKAQQHFSRKLKGSNSFERQRRKVARIYEKISNSRLDNLHKISHQLVSMYDVISLEDLNVKGMIKNHKLSKHISDVSWGNFVTLLQYKMNWNDKQLIKINRWYPSSKTCSNCGRINQDLTLDMREWKCSSCNSILDRDLNAAKNILSEGFRSLSVGTTDYTSGDSNKTSVKEHTSKKLEAQSISVGVVG